VYSQTDSRTYGSGKFVGRPNRQIARCNAIFTEVVNPTARRIPPHEHELPHFCLLLMGSYTEFFHQEQIQYSPMTVAFHPPSTRFHGIVGPSGELSFLIELRDSWNAGLDGGIRIKDVKVELRGGPLVWLALQLHDQVFHLDAAYPIAVEALLSEMLSMAGAANEGLHDPPWLNLVLDMLHSRFKENLTLAEVASAVCVHPAHLARAFHQKVGQTIGQYVDRLRIQHACRQITKSELGLSEIGLDCGYVDQSHFGRVFKRVTGTTPGALRARLDGS
jgi:AraC family transcriptional regulator